MKIVSTTQTYNAEHLIGDALRSVLPFVDACLVCDSGCTDDTINIARQIAGDKLIVRYFDWKDDFSTARNFHLDEATRLGFDWAVTIDSDERLVGVTRSAFNVSQEVESMRLPFIDQSYSKDRAFRLPCKSRWKGPVHETFDTGNFCDMPGCFWEVFKQGNDLKIKLERCVKILEEYSKKNSNPRWRYYLADSHAVLGDRLKAKEIFESCIVDEWSPEEAAWSAFRAADICFHDKQYEQAVEYCEKGTQKFKPMAELYWCAGSCCTWLNENFKALELAQIAVSLGNYKGCNKIPRFGFKYVPALWEKPYEVMAFAFNNLGDVKNRDWMYREYTAAYKAREYAIKSSSSS